MKNTKHYFYLFTAIIAKLPLLGGANKHSIQKRQIPHLLSKSLSKQQWM